MATDPIDFNRYSARTRQQAKAAPAPVSLPPAALPVTGQMPLPRGVVYQSRTPDEVAGLAKLGVGPADDIPENLAEMIAAAQLAANADVSHLFPVSPDTPPLRELPETPIDSLPPEYQAALRKSIQDAAAQMRERAAAPKIEGAGAGINEALMAASAAPEPVTKMTRADIADLRRAGSRASSGSPAPQPVAERAAPQPVQAQPQEEKLDSGVTIPFVQCPRCGCDPQAYDVIKPTSDDKYTYLAAILGGTGSRFLKEVPLFGGAATLTFGSLSAADGRSAFEQLGADHKADPFPTDTAYMARLLEYRLAMSLERISFNGRRDVAVPRVSEQAPDPGQPTALGRVVDWLRDEVLTSESLARATMEAFQQFQRLVESLEARADDPDFWKGIVSPR